MNTKGLAASYQLARERYAEDGVDTDRALEKLARISISIHCWQGDDVGGFENAGQELGGGLAVTGNYPGKARTADELRADAVAAYSLIPGRHRFNLHAIYAETGGKRVDRNELAPEHFARPKAADGMTLSHADPGIRRFWIEHGIACRQIGAAIGAALSNPCVTNVW